MSRQERGNIKIKLENTTDHLDGWLTELTPIKRKQAGTGSSRCPLKFLNAQDTIFKLLPFSQYQEIPQGIPIRLGNHFFLNWKHKKNQFLKIKFSENCRGAGQKFISQNYSF